MLCENILYQKMRHKENVQVFGNAIKLGVRCHVRFFIETFKRYFQPVNRKGKYMEYVELILNVKWNCASDQNRNILYRGCAFNCFRV